MRVVKITNIPGNDRNKKNNDILLQDQSLQLSIIIIGML